MRMSQTNTITFAENIFALETARTSYFFRVTPHGHLEHLYYGPRVPRADAAVLGCKHTAVYGSSVLYDRADPLYCLDSMPLEWSGEGRGDYRTPPIGAVLPDGGATTDFRYVSHTVTAGSLPMSDGLPTAVNAAAALSVLLRDTSGAALTLCYTVFPDCDVITRRAVLRNGGEAPLTFDRLMSCCLDFPGNDLVLMTFGGGWIHEFQKRETPLVPGTQVIESRTGASSNRTNPGFILRGARTDETHGRAWGFNLVYSGNHHASVSLDDHGLVRVMNGISPGRFRWTLAPGEAFETPEAVLSFSDRGLNGLSRNMHGFVNRHIVRGPWAGRERPVLINSWEGFMFDFNREKLLDMARRGKKLGAELFVLDDGWFGARNNDCAGLGDYAVNLKKLPGGLAALAERVRALGMDFGLWFEPEGVNEDSDLFRAHPDWAITDEGREKVYGRSELLLDLTQPQVRDYIVTSVGGVLDSAEISYVKWDMNRHLAGRDGAFAHRYVLGLYDVLRRIFGPRPQILLETCSSGGNRFDLGMLCFSPQIWLSDDTDPIERLDIQKGASYLYPLSAMGAHVSASPHAQTLRATPLCTRFNAACFGCLGYELDLAALPPVEMREIRGQIAFYKARRQLFQFGDFYRYDGPADRETFTCAAPDGGEAVTGHFRRLCRAAPGLDILPSAGLVPGAVYRVRARPQTLRIGSFGGLIRHAVPVKLRPQGPVLAAADRVTGLPDCAEDYTASGAALLSGLPLSNVFNGTGYSREVRLPGDFGSNLYIITRVGKKHESL